MLSSKSPSPWWLKVEPNPIGRSNSWHSPLPSPTSGQSICPSVVMSGLSILMCINICIHTSICPSVHQSVHRSVSPSDGQSVRLFNKNGRKKVAFTARPQSTIFNSFPQLLLSLAPPMLMLNKSLCRQHGTQIKIYGMLSWNVTSARHQSKITESSMHSLKDKSIGLQGIFLWAWLKLEEPYCNFYYFFPLLYISRIA